MDRLAALRRYREQALHSAALISALATSYVDTDSRLRELADRQDDQLGDLLHDFAYKARKTIELATRGGIPIKEEVERKSIVGVPHPGESDKDTELEGYSLAFVLGRIIHSDDLRIERGQVPHQVGDDVLVNHDASWAFTVRSDRDIEGTDHFIFIEFLLARFLEIDEQIQPFLTPPRRTSGET